MADRKLLDAAAQAAAYVGQKRYWTPYAGAQPVECTAWTCSVTASFKAEGMTATVGAVWTKYRGPYGRMDQVWFPSEKWETMPLAAGVAGAPAPQHVCGMQGYNGMIDPPCPACEANRARGVTPTDQRQRFEAWADDQGFPLKRLDTSDGYLDLRTHGAWEAWQAAIAGVLPTDGGKTE